MTKANITQYDSTPSNNADINDINIAENCPASNINNAIRELMAHLKNVDTGSQALTALSVAGDLTVDTSTLKVDSTNNRVGIGTASPSKSLHIRTADSSATAESNSALIIEGTDASRADLQFLGDASAFQAIYFGDNSDADIGRIAYDHTSNSMRFNTNASERMRIDSSGNVGIGTTSMTTGLEIHGSDDNACTIKLRDLSDYSSGTGPTIAFQGKDSSESIRNFSQIKGVSNSSNNGMLIFETRNSGSIAERMRIKNDGNVMINTTSTSPSPGVSLQPSGAIGLGNAGGTSGTSFMEFRRNGTQIGSVTQFGTTGVNFNNSSDYRLKENVSYDFDGTSRLKQLKPARFNFIDNKDITVDGFIAHEVSSIVPEAISGEKDGTETYLDDENKEQTRPVYQGIDQSKLVPLLVKTIQELEARITALENA